jgi:hypothetical protein
MEGLWKKYSALNRNKYNILEFQCGKVAEILGETPCFQPYLHGLESKFRLSSGYLGIQHYSEYVLPHLFHNICK